MSPLVLSAGRLRLVVVPELGAGISDFSMQGPAGYFYPIMRRASAGETNASLLGSFMMAPWVNRIAGARFSFAGKEHVLRATNPEGTAQHGDVRKRPWSLVHAETNQAVLEYSSAGVADSNWPWRYLCRVEYRLTADALNIALSVTNTDTEPFPAGCGHHPYFMRRLWNDLDRLELQAPVQGRYPLDGGCATGPMVPDELSASFATLRPIPEQPVDSVFGGFGGEAILRWPASGVTLRMTASHNMGHLVIFAPHAPSPQSNAPAPIASVAVEPQTQVNDAFNLDSRRTPGTGTVVLGPGQRLETACQLHLTGG